MQAEIRIGMSGGEVAGVLGSPNIVSTDENRNEVWIYDKISTQYVRADAQAGILAIGGGSDVVGGAGASGSQSSGATSQRTLTIVIKFDEAKRLAVRAYARSNDKPITDPNAYQDFFTTLDKAVFLTLHRVD